MQQSFSRLISVAPMMDWTDRHCRYFLRLIAKDVLLYTEMISMQALLHGDRNYLLHFNPAEHPVALQLGGNDPLLLATCARMGEDYGYDEINLNVGCPSSRVSAGLFGACLMQTPSLVAECVHAMQQQVSIPVSIKCRIGIDENDSYEALFNFIETIAKTGCTLFIVHARKAILKGLSPKENRHIPPLQYHFVYRLKQDFPHLTIILNGGINQIEEIRQHLTHVDGVMIGRAAYTRPYLLAAAQAAFCPSKKILTKLEIMEALYPYIIDEMQQGCKLIHITRHILGLFQGEPGAAAFRRYLSERAYQKEADINVLKCALNSLFNINRFESLNEI